MAAPPWRVQEAGEQAVKDSNLRFGFVLFTFSFLFFFFAFFLHVPWGFIYFVFCSAVAVQLMRPGDKHGNRKAEIEMR